MLKLRKYLGYAVLILFAAPFVMMFLLMFAFAWWVVVKDLFGYI